MLVGRDHELKTLNQVWASKKPELLVLYGRRRIGKSALIHHFCQDKNALLFEALEGEHTLSQIRHFSTQLRKQIDDPMLKGIEFKDWSTVFEYLNSYLTGQNKKTILFFDELQWQAAGQTKLIALLKFYWDNKWKNQKILLILCGSIGSFMVKKVLKSKALYGRVTSEIHLKGLDLAASQNLLKNLRSSEEVLMYQLVFGGVPKYLEDIDTSQSFTQNIDKICFSTHGNMVQEMERIFASQFREAGTYKRLVKQLMKGPQSFGELSKSIKMKSGGGLKTYLDNLVLSDMIAVLHPFGKSTTSKDRKYILSDEFLVFYNKFMLPHLKLIQNGLGRNPFVRLAGTAWRPWLGLAFERFCHKQALQLARMMNFEDVVLDFGPIYLRGKGGLQFDLAFARSARVITLCEIKFSDHPIDTSVIATMQRRCSLYQAQKGYTIERALITVHGADENLKKSEYFHHILELKDFFQL